MEQIHEEYKQFMDYEISNLGNVRKKLKSGKYNIINGSVLNRGYKYFQLQREGKRHNYLIHQIVAKLFIGERPEGLVVDHIDRNKQNNNLSNLRYITQKENCFNHDKVISDIPIDVVDRRKKVEQRYRIINREKLLQIHKEYYNKNKTISLQKEKEKRHADKIILICPTCNKQYEIQRKTVRYKKTNNCNICNSLEQLKKIHSKS